MKSKRKVTDKVIIQDKSSNRFNYIFNARMYNGNYTESDYEYVGGGGSSWYTKAIKDNYNILSVIRSSTYRVTLCNNIDNFLEKEGLI